jgi:prephenate dehydratase
MKLATLGPRGTFSHEAALKLDPDGEISFQRTIRDVFETVESGGADAGLIPLENSVSGTVAESLDSLNDSRLTIEREVIHPVIHHLAARSGECTIRKILAHPQSYASAKTTSAATIPRPR